MGDIDALSDIGLHKGIQWELAKGHLRALIRAAGAVPVDSRREPEWTLVRDRIEAFIVEFEDDGFHE